MSDMGVQYDRQPKVRCSKCRYLTPLHLMAQLPTTDKPLLKKICLKCGKGKIRNEELLIRARGYLKHQDLTGREWSNPEQKYEQKVRFLVLNAYGKRCACCGESRHQFLALDHKAGGGGKERKRMGLTNAKGLFLYLIRNNFPPGYQILCHNCNLAKSFYGYCH